MVTGATVVVVAMMIQVHLDRAVEAAEEHADIHLLDGAVEATVISLESALHSITWTRRQRNTKDTAMKDEFYYYYA